MASAKYQCGPASLSKVMDAELRALVAEFECVVATQIIVTTEYVRGLVRHYTGRLVRSRSREVFYS